MSYFYLYNETIIQLKSTPVSSLAEPVVIDESLKSLLTVLGPEERKKIIHLLFLVIYLSPEEQRI